LAASQLRAAGFLFIGVPLLLGSWLALLFSARFIIGIAWRAVQEERVLLLSSAATTTMPRACATV
jgi:protein-S-isoprenylcysteine O-methyltransferase Ste14